MKKLYILPLILIIITIASCQKEIGEPYTVLRRIGDSTLITREQAYLYIQAYSDFADNYDYIIDENQENPIRYFADVYTSFYDSDPEKSPILAYGHVWSITDSLPILDLNSNHNKITGSIPETNAFEKFSFETKVTDLEMDTFYYVRSFVITETDTGYNPKSHKMKTLIPQNLWFQRNDFLGQARTEAVSFQVENNVYIATGFDGLNLLDDVWQYDIVTDTWTQKASIGSNPNLKNGRRKSAVAFTIDEKAFIGTGNSSTNPNVEVRERNFFVYNTELNQFVFGDVNRPVQPDSMPDIPRVDAVAFTLNGKGYVALGRDNFPLNDLYEYDLEEEYSGNPKSAWSPLSSYNFPGGQRTEAMVTTLGDRAYIGFGVDQNGKYKADLYSFNMEEGWMNTGTFSEPVARANGVAFGLSYTRKGRAFNRVYFGTGRIAENEFRNDFWAYDIDQKNWTQIADAGNTPREGAVSFTLNRDDYYDVDRRGFVVGGQGYINSQGALVKLKDVWEYLP